MDFFQEFSYRTALETYMTAFMYSLSLGNCFQPIGRLTSLEFVYESDKEIRSFNKGQLEPILHVDINEAGFQNVKLLSSERSKGYT